MISRPSSSERPRKLSRAVLGLQRADRAGGLHGAELQGAGQAKQVLPMLRDQAKVDALRREVVQRALIGFAVHAPEAAAADVGQAGTELVAEQVVRCRRSCRCTRRCRS